MSKTEPLVLHYVGDLSPSSLEARELLQVLSGFTNIAQKAGRTFHGTTTQASLRIEHVQAGTIDLQWVFELAAVAQSGFAALPALSFGIKDVHGLIKAWLDILKFLQGHPPQNVQTVTKGNALQIENANGEIHVVNGNIYNTLVINNIGKDAERLQVPTKHGADRVELKQGRRKIASYSAKDLENFKSVKPTDKPLVSEIDAILEVIAPVLEGEGMWRARYGRLPLTAKLTDENYRQKVLDGTESFKHGDRLKVRLKTIQEIVGSKVSTKHLITKVLGRP
jgi:hypothetical protein